MTKRYRSEPCLWMVVNHQQSHSNMNLSLNSPVHVHINRAINHPTGASHQYMFTVLNPIATTSTDDPGDGYGFAIDVDLVDMTLHEDLLSWLGLFQNQEEG